MYDVPTMRMNGRHMCCALTCCKLLLARKPFPCPRSGTAASAISLLHCRKTPYHTGIYSTRAAACTALAHDLASPFRAMAA